MIEMPEWINRAHVDENVMRAVIWWWEQGYEAEAIAKAGEAAKT
jgi:hypothetical protein